MTAVERSPLGDERNRPVRCLCGLHTFNHSGLCERCKRKDWSESVRLLDALRSVVEVGSVAPERPALPAAATGPTSVSGWRTAFGSGSAPPRPRRRTSVPYGGPTGNRTHDERSGA